ncbi:DUF5689 domain-containing protein [Flavobacterium filum]|uniref:DUF5689 domain-containing protein n=1 Tax=Flavobacterium filum TaxID=370974 RepID=UPI000410B2F0|nr:DUF5689 domain-containing protein [Flavobacterium filum]
MKTNFLKSILFTALIAGISTSCVNDDDYEVPNLDCVGTTLQKNKEVADITATATVTQYLEDDVIEAYVTTSDEEGTFFKSISFQTLDGSRGFSVPVDVTSTFINFEPGRKVMIKLQNSYTDISNGGLRIGDIYVNSSNVPSVGRIPEYKYKSVLNRTCNIVPESQLVRTLTVNEAKQDANLNTLIELDGVQFVDAVIGKNYYEATQDLGGATNHLLTNNVGNTVIFRTSSFARFAGKPAQTGYGKVRGVMTKFGSDYQFVARYERDIQLTGERVEIDFAPPIVGNNVTYLCSLNETFESYTAGSNTTGQNDFPNFINDPFVGNAYWRCRSNGTPANKYIQMTAFSTAQNVQTYFIVPVDFTCANSISFQTRASFNVGAVLKVYYSTDYQIGGVVNPANLVDITSNFAISTSNSSTAAFTNSGVWNFPTSLTGNGVILFEYVGSALSSPALTTNMDIDNIVIQ